MRGHRAVMVVAGAAAAVWCGAPQAVTAAPAASAVAQAGTWGMAISVPGLQALSQGGRAELNSVSCGSAGNCVAVGRYSDGSLRDQAFLAGERNGRWRRAMEVPGSEILNAGGSANVSSVSCATAGNCAVGGTYQDSARNWQGFVVSKTDGTWGQAIEVPGLGTLNKGGNARIYSVSCATAGNCAAVGRYDDGSGRFQAFAVSQTNGTWGNAIKIPGSGILNTGGFAEVYSVSCGAAGNCAAGGTYAGSPGFQPFVVSKTDGTWGRAIEVPGTGALNAGDASVFSVSCGAAGNCAAGGGYTDSAGRFQAFVVSQTNGTWGQAIEIPGTGALNAGGLARVTSVSCTAAGYCAAGGTYRDRAHHAQAFAVSKTNGTWGQAIKVPGSGILNAGGDASISSVSCATAGNCAAGGFYHDSAGHNQAFVVGQANGT